MDAIFQKASDDSAGINQELDNGLNEAGTNLDEEKAAMEKFLTDTAGVFNEAITSMNALDVPAEAKADHDAFIAAAKASVLLASRLQDDISNAKTDTEAQNLISQFNDNYQPLLDAGDTACVNLQDIAATHGLDTDLACQGPTSG